MKRFLMTIAVVMALMAPAKLSADSITPNLLSVTPDGGGNFDWEWELYLSTGSEVWSAASICASFPSTPNCPGGVPVAGSGMFNFYDFDGAISMDVSGMLGGGTVTDDGIGWFSLVYPLGDNVVGPELPAGTECATNVDCPTDDSVVMNALLAYVDGPTIGLFTGGISNATVATGVGTIGPGLLGTVVIKSIYGTTGSNPETYAGFDRSLTNQPPNQTNYGTYLPPAVNPVPEPATMLLLGTGLLGIGSRLRKRSKKETPKV